MTTLTKASAQWAKRPAEERFTSLTAMHEAAKTFHTNCIERTIANRDIRAAPVEGDTKALALMCNGLPALPSHWAFGQLCSLIGAPAGYLRRLPVPMVADCLNYGLHLERSVESIGTLLDTSGDGVGTLAAATGPNYGRIWNDRIIQTVMDEFGDGVTGKFTVPGEFGKAVQVDENNTTLYRSDRDMFIFLADETNRITIPNRRGGQSGTLARGFFLYNSEVGASTLGVDTFLFDYACSNRMVWGAQHLATIKVRHTAGANHRWLEEVAPALKLYADGETHSIVEAVTMAQAKRIGNEDDVTKFLEARFSGNQVKAIKLAHEVEEQRPIETIFDAVTGITAYAKGMNYTADRVDVERAAGKVMALAQ